MKAWMDEWINEWMTNGMNRRMNKHSYFLLRWFINCCVNNLCIFLIMWWETCRDMYAMLFLWCRRCTACSSVQATFLIFRRNTFICTVCRFFIRQIVVNHFECYEWVAFDDIASVCRWRLNSVKTFQLKECFVSINKA